MDTRTLPPELILWIANLASRRTLVSASSVCKKWRRAISPILYRSVVLHNDAQIKGFSRAVAAGDEASSQCTPSISNYVQALSVHQTPGKGEITELGLPPLEHAIPRLCQLRHISWGINFIPQSLEIIELLQTRCSKLNSVKLRMPYGLDLTSEQDYSRYTTLLAFKNLSSFTINTYGALGKFDQEHIPPLKLMLSNSPGLQSLGLDLYATSGYNRLGSSVLIVKLLGRNTILPDLRQLELTGQGDLMEAVLSSPDALVHSFRDFLSHHTRLEDLTIKCHMTSDYFRNNVDPEHLARTLPSLKRFEGPQSMCDQLLRSSLAGQLEYVGVLQLAAMHTPSFGLDGDYELRSLPMLRELRIETEDAFEPFEIMRAVMPMANGLEILRISYISLIEFSEFLELLEHTPNLRHIYVADRNWSFMKSSKLSAKNSMGVDGRKKFRSMKEICPKLQPVDDDWEGERRSDTF